MNFIKTIAILFFPIVILISSCGKCHNYDCTSPPGPLSIRIMNDSIDLIYSGYYNVDSISISYSTKEGKFVIDKEIYSDSLKKTSRIISNEITWKSVEGIKWYHLHLSETEIDTIYLNVESVTHDCCSSHPIIEFEVDGVEPEYDNSTNSYIIMRFDKTI